MPPSKEWRHRSDPSGALAALVVILQLEPASGSYTLDTICNYVRRRRLMVDTGTAYGAGITLKAPEGSSDYHTADYFG